MAESIFVRVKRIVSGNIESAVDRLETAGGETVMREAIREVERTIDEVKIEYDAVRMKRLQAVRQSAMIEEKRQELTVKAEGAMSQGREDLAEAAFSRQIDFEDQLAKLSKAIDGFREDEAQFENHQNALKQRHDQMKSDLSDFLAARRDVQIAVASVSPTASERRIDKSEEAFNRAMEGAGGVAGVTRSDGQVARKLGELDTLDRNQKIADRIASLKDQRLAG